MKTLALIATMMVSSLAHAGVFELGATTNYRISKIDADNFQESKSITGSFSYYFMQQSAIEFSYTKGNSTLGVRAAGDTVSIRYVTDFELIGADLILTLGDKQSFIQPYIKAGAAQIKKKIVQESDLGSVTYPQLPTETVPSAGLGFKVRLTQTFALKVGVDSWVTNLGKSDETVDWASRAGISWLF